MSAIPSRRHPRAAGILLATLLATLLTSLTALLSACGDDAPPAVDLRVVPARLDERPGSPPPEGWHRIEFAGNPRVPATTYVVADAPLLTGWNITAFNTATDADGVVTITFRPNAAGRQKLADFSAEPAHLKQPLGLQIDGRWADFSALLRPPGDRMTLHGLTTDEVARLAAWMKVR